MSAKRRTLLKTTVDGLADMQETLKILNGKKVRVGVLNGKHAWLAGIHEYGCRIPVTPKMRAYLHSIGIHLRKDTKVIIIPERSFLRAGFDAKKEGVARKSDKVLPDVIKGTMSTDEYLKMVGLTLSTQIKKFARDLKDPPNSAVTVKQKGSSNPLVDTGDMINGITYKVE